MPTCVGVGHTWDQSIERVFCEAKVFLLRRSTAGTNSLWCTKAPHANISYTE